MMEAELAKELREAADQLLDLGRLQHAALPSSSTAPSPHLQQRRQPLQQPIAISKPTLPTFSSSSKLEVLYSPTDVRPWQWPAPQPNANRAVAAHDTRTAPGNGSVPLITLQVGGSLEGDADDNLPEIGLSSRIESVKAATSRILVEDRGGDTTADQTGAHQDVQHRAASPSKLRARTPMDDVYINQYGERVINGKVVGRTLGGRPRPHSRQADTPSTTIDSSASRTTTTLPHVGSSPCSKQPASMHALSSTDATSPPSFFLESFPDAFSPAPSHAPAAAASSSSSPKPKKERRSSKGGPPFILKAPRAVAGALTLASSDDVDDPPILHDTSFTTASDFGSPSSSSHILRSVSGSSSRTADTELASGVKGLALHNVDAGHLSPNESVPTSDSTRSRFELALMRRPTPTIGLTQANVYPVVLHGNRRQARASGLPHTNSSDVGNKASSKYTSPAVSPPSTSQALPSPPASFFSTRTAAQSAHDSITNSGDRDSPRPPEYAIHGSASEPSSPLLSLNRLSRQHPNTQSPAQSQTGRNGQEEGEENEDEADDENASLESAPSSLISLPVSTLTSSSRTASHHRRRSSVHHTLSSSQFARQVYIGNWSIIGSQARGWVVYELRIVTKQGTAITAHKRFSSFVKLRQTLLCECKDEAKWLARLPSKSTGLLSKYDAKHLETRRRALQRWLELVCLDSVWGASEALREWILAND